MRILLPLAVAIWPPRCREPRPPRASTADHQSEADDAVPKPLPPERRRLRRRHPRRPRAEVSGRDHDADAQVILTASPDHRRVHPMTITTPALNVQLTLRETGRRRTGGTFTPRTIRTDSLRIIVAHP